MLVLFVIWPKKELIMAAQITFQKVLDLNRRYALPVWLLVADLDLKRLTAEALDVLAGWSEFDQDGFDLPSLSWYTLVQIGINEMLRASEDPGDLEMDVICNPRFYAQQLGLEIAEGEYVSFSDFVNVYVRVYGVSLEHRREQQLESELESSY